MNRISLFVSYLVFVAGIGLGGQLEDRGIPHWVFLTASIAAFVILAVLNAIYLIISFFGSDLDTDAE